MKHSESPANLNPTARSQKYRGRLAPSPTGFLHLGHARTFWIAQQRARQQNGQLILRNDNLDVDRCRTEFATAMLEDLRWFGFQWQEGPNCGGLFGPYSQSERMLLYRSALLRLREARAIYPCTCSRKDLRSVAQAPHAADDELIYPGICRPAPQSAIPNPQSAINWRFRVPDSQPVTFTDGHLGPQQFIAGKDFGDFIVWRHDDVPAYQLAVVVDDAAMQITEVVRGADLLLSTARQLLLYRALALNPPAFYHCPLMTDDSGVRLAKRHDALNLRALRAQGATPENLRQGAGW